MNNRTIIIGSLVAAIILGGGGAAIAYVTTSEHSSPTRSAAAAPPSAAADSSPSPTATSAHAIDTADARRFATSIADMFCRPGLDQQVWFAALSPYFSADAASQFSTTDPANVPCSMITGAGQPVGDRQTTLAAAYQFPTDGTSITVSINRNSVNEPWQVVYVIINS